VGMGGLGSSVSIYLTVAGIGHLVVIDSDRVELPNLNRQILLNLPSYR
jgi:molybdopterin/thiamine biosynthesis adenylyltransferase